MFTSPTDLKQESYDMRNYDYVRHYLALKKDGIYYKCVLFQSDGMCMSGYTTATWADFKITQSNHFILDRCTMLPIEDTKLLLDVDLNRKIINSDFLEFSHEGGDNYYPTGKYNIDYSYFDPKS